MAALFTSTSTTPVLVSFQIRRSPLKNYSKRFVNPINASLSSSSSPESKSNPPRTEASIVSSTTPSTPFVETPSRPPESGFNYALANPNGNPLVRFVRSSESSIERVRQFQIKLVPFVDPLGPSNANCVHISSFLVLRLETL